MPKRAASELNPFWVDFFLNLPQGWSQNAPRKNALPTLGFIPLFLWDNSFETASEVPRYYRKVPIGIPVFHSPTFFTLCSKHIPQNWNPGLIPASCDPIQGGFEAKLSLQIASFSTTGRTASRPPIHFLCPKIRFFVPTCSKIAPGISGKVA